jgi:predicted PurR-regulated permease PerM
MSESYPTPKQQKVIWRALTALAWSVWVALLLLGGWIATQLLALLYPVLLPLGCAAIVAFILDPVLSVLERWRWSRATALLVLLVLVGLVGVLLLLVIVPPLLSQSIELVTELPEKMSKLQTFVEGFFGQHPALQEWVNSHWPQVQSDLPAKVWSNWHRVWGPVAQIFSWFGLALGFLFVPLYVYYFLLEKETIATQWSHYVPLKQSPWRDEVVVVVTEINKYLIVFFRGQVLVGLGIGVLTSLGLVLIGLPYALLIGLVAGTLSVIPYLGVVSSLVPALGLSLIHVGGWSMPLLVLGVFAVVQFIEGFVLSPWILGDRTGLHPLAIIVGILVWSLILPGLLGPILAVPLTATLRVLMHRYVWLKVVEPTDQSDLATSSK